MWQSNYHVHFNDNLIFLTFCSISFGVILFASDASNVCFIFRLFFNIILILILNIHFYWQRYVLPNLKQKQNSDFELAWVYCDPKLSWCRIQAHLQKKRCSEGKAASEQWRKVKGDVVNSTYRTDTFLYDATMQKVWSKWSKLSLR